MGEAAVFIGIRFDSSIWLIYLRCLLTHFLLCSGTFWSQLKSIVPPKNERQKLLPLGLMFFCILFNYTILRDTKDVLMITAYKSGAEVIPFIKTYCNLPAAIVSFSHANTTEKARKATCLLFRLTRNASNVYRGSPVFMQPCVIEWNSRMYFTLVSFHSWFSLHLSPSSCIQPEEWSIHMHS